MYLQFLHYFLYSNAMKKYFYYGLLLVNIAVIIFFWIYPTGLVIQNLGDLFVMLGRLSGLFAAFFVLLQFLLMGRSAWLEGAFGLDKLSNIHRLNGYLSLFFILVHPIFITFGYSQLFNVPYQQQYIFQVQTMSGVLLAGIASNIFLVVVVSSIYIVKKRLKYEMWYGIHLLTYLAVALAFTHQFANGTDLFESTIFRVYWYGLYIFVFGNLLVYRILKPFYLFNKHKFVVEKVVPETKDTNSVYISGKDLEKFKVQPGQFMKLIFVAKGMWWQSHPFSLSMVPDGKNLRISIKNLGDFTSKIKDMPAGTKVLIDGPYGVFTKKSSKKDKVMFIAGGIGITPIRSLVEQLAREGKDVVLLYANRTREDIAFKNEFDELTRKLRFPIHYFLSDEEVAGYQFGRIEKDKIQYLVPDFIEREVFLCGPVPMMEGTKKNLLDLGLRKDDIHYEKFSL